MFISSWWVNKPALTAWLFPLGCHSLMPAAGRKPAQVTLTLQLLIWLYPGAHFRAWLCSPPCQHKQLACATMVLILPAARSLQAQELLFPLSLVSKDWSHVLYWRTLSSIFLCHKTTNCAVLLQLSVSCMSGKRRAPARTCLQNARGISSSLGFWQ